MSLVRRKALEISSWVTWLASPGCKEWAEGLEREVAFIQSDWRALAWAIGSVRVVMDRRETPFGSLAEVPAAAKKYFAGRWEISATYFTYVFLCVVLGATYYETAIHQPYHAISTATMQIGACLLAAGLLFLGSRYYFYLRQAVWAPVPDDLYECAARYRDALRRDLKFNYQQGTRYFIEATSWGSLLLSSLASLLHTDFPLPLKIVLVPCSVVPVGLMFLRAYTDMRKLQSRIEDLDALLATGAEGVGR